MSIAKAELLIISLIFPVLATAQSGTSTISGTIKDGTGSAVPSARVQVINDETGVSQSTVTNEEGVFRAGSLLPGSYRVDVEADGFQKLVRGPVTLQVGQVIALDLTLQVGNVSETVNVTEAAPLIESQTSTVGQVVNRQMLAGLPLPNRAASSLAALAPGVVMIDTGAGTAENYPGFQRRRRTRAQPEFHAGRRQRIERRGPHAPAAAHQPAGGRHAGVQGHRQQLFGRVWTLDRRHRDHVDSLRNQPVSRQPVRVAAERYLQRAQLLLGQSVARALEPVRRNLRRSHPQGQDALLRDLGADRAS